MNCKVKQTHEMSDNDHTCLLNKICWDKRLESLTTWKLVISSNFRTWISTFRALYVNTCCKMQCFLSTRFFGVSYFTVRLEFFIILWTLINQSHKKQIIILINFDHFLKIPSLFLYLWPFRYVSHPLHGPKIKQAESISDTFEKLLI